MTAGLLADFIAAFTMTPTEARRHLYGKAHERIPGGRNVVYYSLEEDKANTHAA